jgi:uncharacterized protein with ATP-grasp and redox domains
METYLDCIPCFFKQALEISRLAKADEQARQAIVNDVAGIVLSMTGQSCPPEIGRRVNETICVHLGRKDFFKDIKERSNRKALALLPTLRERVESSDDPLRAAVELAIAGNIIDYGAKHAMDLELELLKIIDRDFVVKHGDLFEYEDFKKDLQQASEFFIWPIMREKRFLTDC